MGKAPLTAFILLTISTLTSCELGSCVRGEGDVVRSAVQLGSFKAITLKGSIDMRIGPGDAQLVEIEAQPNLAELVITEIRDGELIIEVEECFRTKRPFLVHVSTPPLEALTIQGSGDMQGTGPMTAEDLDLRIQGSGDMRLEVAAENLRTTIQGSGDVFLSGSATRFETRVQGSGDVRAGELAAQDIKASIMGSGDIGVQCRGVLDASIMGSGDITYRGTPSGVIQNIKGSGSIRSVE